MRIIFMVVAAATMFIFSSCTKVCTDELRMITIKLHSTTETNIVLDEVYTIRKSTGEKIVLSQPMVDNIFVVLDDSYHPNLKNDVDEFSFIGMKGNQKVVDEVFKISADGCHINKKSGKDSVAIN